MSAPPQLQQIIELLNAAPFNYTETLISLTTKTSSEKIQLLNNVIAHFDNKHTNTNLQSTEPPDATAARLLDYLSNTIQYKFQSADDAVTLFNPEADNNDIVYHVLYYILTNQSLIQKRSHIARYMRLPDIPNDFIVDNTVQQLVQQLQTLQQSWKQQHQTIQNLQLSPPVSELQHEMHRSSSERIQINNKIQQQQHKIQQNSDYDANVFNEILKYTNLIRLQQEEEEQLYNYASDIKYKLDNAKQNKQALTQQLQQLKSNTNAAPTQLVEQLQQSMQQKRRDLQQLDAQNKRIQKQYAELNSLVNGSTVLMTENDVSSIQQYYNDINHTIEQLQAQISAVYSSNSDLDLYQKRLYSNNQKRDKLTAELTEVQTEYSELTNELNTLQHELTQLNNTSNVTSFNSQAQYDAFTQQLNNKTSEYNQKKSDLNQLNDTIEQYQHIIQVLNNNTLTADERTVEVQQLYTVARQIQQQYLAEKQLQQQQIDLSTQNTAELKKLYNTLCMQIKHYKQQLQPDIESLRTVRQQFAEYKNTYLEQCNAYKLLQLQYSADSVKHDTQLTALNNDLTSEQKIRNEINTLVTELNDRNTKLQQEIKYESGIEKYSAQYKTYVQRCIGEASKHEEQIRSLQHEKNELDSNYDTAVQSAQQFALLKNLLDCKLKLKQQDNNTDNNICTDLNTQALVF